MFLCGNSGGEQERDVDGLSVGVGEFADVVAGGEELTLGVVASPADRAAGLFFPAGIPERLAAVVQDVDLRRCQGKLVLGFPHTEQRGFSGLGFGKQLNHGMSIAGEYYRRITGA